MKYALIGISALGWAAVASAGFDDKLPPEAYRDPIDQQIARTGKGIPGRPYPCAYEEVRNGIKVIAMQSTDLCVKMLPPKICRGLWRNDFEGSRFCPEPAKECSFKSPGERIWLSQTPGRPGGELYRVAFVGRMTAYKGPYGHVGVFDQEVTMGRVIEMKLISAPPPPDEATVASMKKQCAAISTCDVNELMQSIEVNKQSRPH